MESGIPCVVLLGKTGAGKSAVANKIIGLNVFNESARAQYCTTETQLETGKWLGNGSSVAVIDTPDPEHRESQFLDFLRGISVTAFIIVIDVTNPRYGYDTQLMLQLFEHTFTSEFLKHSCVVFTRCDKGAESIWEPQVGACYELCQSIGADFHIPPLPAFFVSTRKGESGWGPLKQFIDSKPRFSCEVIRTRAEICDTDGGEAASTSFIKTAIKQALKILPILRPIVGRCIDE